MACVGLVVDRLDSWAESGRRIATDPRALAVVGTLLGLLAAVESIAHAAGASQAANAGVTALYSLALALATTLPLAFLWAESAAAGVAVSAACVLSLTAFQTLTVPPTSLRRG